jgi:hypothetical protein
VFLPIIACRQKHPFSSGGAAINHTQERNGEQQRKHAQGGTERRSPARIYDYPPPGQRTWRVAAIAADKENSQGQAGGEV